MMGKTTTLLLNVLLFCMLSQCVSSLDVFNEPALTPIRSIRPRALSGIFSRTTDNSYYAAYIRWSATQNTNALTSTITAIFYIEKVKASTVRPYNLASPPYSITIDGLKFSGTQNFDFPAGCAVGTTQTIGNATKTVKHNRDGSISGVSISARFETGISFGNVTVSGTASLNPIPVSVTVELDGNGGNISAASIKNVTYGSKYKTLPTATRTGYTFKGWYTKPSGGSEVTESTKVTLLDSHTIYAQWVINNYTITFISDEKVIKTERLEYRKNITLIESSEKCYRFGRWYSDVNMTTEFTDTAMPANNVTLYGKLSVINYTVTLNYMNGTRDSVTQDCGTSFVPQAPTKAGYTFMNWYTDPDFTQPISERLSITQNTVLYAKWAEIISSQVEIVFLTRGLTKEDFLKIIKQYTGADFTILKYDNSETDETRFIIKFPDDESAKFLVELLRESSENEYNIKSVKFNFDDLGSFSLLLHPFVLLYYILQIIF